MTNKEHQVTLVLEPDCGERLRSLAFRSQVWVIDTPANHIIAEEFWQEHPNHTPESGITMFKVSEDETTEQSCLRVLERILKLGENQLRQVNCFCDEQKSLSN
jgi:hypothetical protein